MTEINNIEIILAFWSLSTNELRHLNAQILKLELPLKIDQF
jgi:hypothetical protein